MIEAAAPALDDPALVMGEGTERTGTKTAPVTGYRELDWFKSGDRGFVRGVCPTGEREIVDMVEFFSA